MRKLLTFQINDNYVTAGAEDLGGTVEEEDDGEGRGQDGVVVQVLPPYGCPAGGGQYWLSVRAGGKIPEELPLHIGLPEDSVVGVHHPGPQHAGRK